ncbi:MAG: hypothetical protein ABI162_01670 [Luteolibacter sp.]
MSLHTIHIRSERPDLLIEFDLPPGTHARIGASREAEVTLPLGGIPPFSCILGRFHDGRLYLADLDGALSRRVDPPAALPIPPYQFEIFQPHDGVAATTPPVVFIPPKKKPATLGIPTLVVGIVVVLGLVALIVSQCGQLPSAPLIPAQISPQLPPGKPAPTLPPAKSDPMSPPGR